jgi:Ulp1 family protease
MRYPILQALYLDPEQIISMRHSNIHAQQVEKELAVKEDKRAQSHFFSSHFFTKLREVPVSKFDEAYAGVQRWSRNVDLFSSKFVFVPIAEHLHWSLAILCNLHALGATVAATRQQKVLQQQQKQQRKQQQKQQQKQQKVQQEQHHYDITDSQISEQSQECIISNHDDDDKAVKADVDDKQMLHGDDNIQIIGDGASNDISSSGSPKATADSVKEHDTSPSSSTLAAAAAPTATAAAAAAAGGVDTGLTIGVDDTAANTADGMNGSSSSDSQQQQQTEQSDSATISDTPCIIFLDSLSMHQPNRISRYLRLYVEQEWAKTYPNKDPLNLAKDDLPLVQPSAPMQSNGCDCGVFVLQYAEEMFMRWPAVRGHDAKAALSTEFTHKMFTDKVIVRKRPEIRQLLDRYKTVYQSRIKEEKAAVKAIDKQKRAQEPNGTDQQVVSAYSHHYSWYAHTSTLL